MRRRDFITALGGGVAAWPLAARAQRTAIPVIGYLAAGNPNSEKRLVDAFLKGLGEAGYEDGKNARIEYRWAENQYDRLPSMAADLVGREIAVIAATTTPAVRTAKAAAGAIPIVFTTIADPVQIGFVASLNRPGGNVTGATMLSVEVGPKLMELLHGAVPSASTMALLRKAASRRPTNSASRSTFSMPAPRVISIRSLPNWASSRPVHWSSATMFFSMRRRSN
jgi:putative tryptophan/tyrosine transport system substrate-binding protein